jgi:hypothetical protein
LPCSIAWHPNATDQRSNKARIFVDTFGVSGESLIDSATPVVGILALQAPPAGANGAARNLGFDQHIIFLGMAAADRAGSAGKKLTFDELKFDLLGFHFPAPSASEANEI